MTLKQKIYDHYLQVINDKITALQQVLADLKESGSNETKSTAGDKHETALAMLQIEQANTRKQLQGFIDQKITLEKINPVIIPSMIGLGSLVKTNRGYLFISVSLGRALVNNISVIALSPQSPLGKKMLGLRAGECITMNDIAYSIEQIE